MPVVEEVGPARDEIGAARRRRPFGNLGVGPGELSPFTWNSYDCTTAIIEKVGDVAVLGADGALYIPRGALVDAVRGLNTWTGISGTYTCAPVGDCNIQGPQFHRVENGKFVPVN